MLSDHERRELALIEQSLAFDERRLARALTRRRWPPRALVTFGSLTMAVGSMGGGNEPLLLQGLLAVVAGILWSRRQTRTAAERADGGLPSPNPRQRRPAGW